MTNFVKSAVVAAAVLVAAGTYWAVTNNAEANIYGEQVVHYLDTQHASSAADGYAQDPRRGDLMTSLQEGGAHDFSMRLEGGHSYRIVGACDDDCTDVDLKVFDSSGRMIGSDVALDDHPAVDIDLARDEVLTVRVEMATCGTEPCYAGARILSR